MASHRHGFERIVETVEQVCERVADAVERARDWWHELFNHGGPHLSNPAAELPADDDHVAEALAFEQLAIGEQVRAAQDREAGYLAVAEEAGVRAAALERQAAEEERRVAAVHAAAVAASAAARQATFAAEELAAKVAALAHERLAQAQAAMAAAEAATAPGRALVDRAEKRAAKETPDHAEQTRKKVRNATDLVAKEADYPIPWVSEVIACGARPMPVGAFLEPIQLSAPHAQVVGATGQLSAVEWGSAAALAQAVAVISAQRIDTGRVGGQVKHLGHGVLSKPNDGQHAAQKWTPESAMRAARHYLVSQGAQPDEHDMAVFLHSQLVKRGSKVVKIEEAVHVLWSRVRRSDGALHECQPAFIAAVVGRARWDNAAGIDPSRIGMTDSAAKPVRDGLKALRGRKLEAVYRDPSSMRIIEHVSLLGRAHAARLGAEAIPDAGDIAGTWTPKPAYRSAKDVWRIFAHCMQGD